SRLRSMVGLAESTPAIALTPDKLDADPWALNLENGTLTLQSGELDPHRPEPPSRRSAGAELPRNGDTDGTQGPRSLGTIWALTRETRRGVSCNPASYLVGGAGFEPATSAL